MLGVGIPSSSWLQRPQADTPAGQATSFCVGDFRTRSWFSAAFRDGGRAARHDRLSKKVRGRRGHGSNLLVVHAPWLWADNARRSGDPSRVAGRSVNLDDSAMVHASGWFALRANAPKDSPHVLAGQRPRRSSRTTPSGEGFGHLRLGKALVHVNLEISWRGCVSGC